MASFVKFLLLFVLFLEIVVCYPSLKLDRVRRQSEDISDDKNEKRSNPVDTFRDILRTVSESIRNLAAIKQKLGSDALPIIQSAGDTVENLYKSGLVESGAKIARTVADNANNVVSTVVTSGERVVPVVNQVSSTISGISSPLIKIALCTLICPLQTEDEKVRCQKDNCARP